MGILLRVSSMSSIKLLTCRLRNVDIGSHLYHFAWRLGLFEGDLAVERIVLVDLLAAFLSLGHSTSVD